MKRLAEEAEKGPQSLPLLPNGPPLSAFTPTMQPQVHQSLQPGIHHDLTQALTICTAALGMMLDRTKPFPQQNCRCWCILTLLHAYRLQRWLSHSRVSNVSHLILSHNSPVKTKVKVSLSRSSKAQLECVTILFRTGRGALQGPPSYSRRQVLPVQAERVHKRLTVA